MFASHGRLKTLLFCAFLHVAIVRIGLDSWFSTVFYTTRSLCHLSGAVLDPALFSPVFTHPSVHQPACPETHHRTPTFSEIWKTEVEKRRTALAPRWNAKINTPPGYHQSLDNNLQVMGPYKQTPA